MQFHFLRPIVIMTNSYRRDYDIFLQLRRNVGIALRTIKIASRRFELSRSKRLYIVKKIDRTL